MNNGAVATAAEPDFVRFHNSDELYASLADEIAGRVAAGVARDGQASLVVSGGTTPGGLYDVLSTRAVAWKDVTVTLSDERWVDPNCKRSNENLARTRLMRNNAAVAQLVPFKTAHGSAHEAESEVNAALAAMSRPFDVVLLGMGTDGHVASLIPGAEGLARALDRRDPALVRAVNPPNLMAMGERMTLTLRAILNARWIVLLIRGQEKLAAYHQALAGGDILAAPVRSVLQQTDVPLSIYWTA